MPTALRVGESMLDRSSSERETEPWSADNRRRRSASEPYRWRDRGMDTGLTAERLREIPSLVGEPPSLDLRDLPVEPTSLFVRWFDDAVGAGVPEPHAATLATVDRDGIPDARTLILKGLDARGWAVAGTRSSRKGHQLAEQPAAALNFWWQPIMRAVRVRGRVEEASREDSEADLAARSATARADSNPGEWVVWRIRPSRVEFWQGAVDRRHIRIVYSAAAGGWTRIEGVGGSKGGDPRIDA